MVLSLSSSTSWWTKNFKALSGADLITLPPHGGLRICKSLNGNDFVFLTGCRCYGRYCLHIPIASLLHCSCGVFIPIKRRFLWGIYILITPGSSNSLFSISWNCTYIVNLADIGYHHTQFWCYSRSSLPLFYGLPSRCLHACRKFFVPL